MKKLIITLLASCFISTGFSATDNTPPSKPVVLNKFLQFILTAQTGNIQQSSNNNYQLTLNNVSPSVTYFTNRPRRIFGSMTTQFFLKRWIKPPPRDFKSTPPNAAIISFNETTKQLETNVVTLQMPVYDAQKKSLSFKIAPIDSTSWKGSKQLNQVTITMAEVTVCGTFGAWGNLPGEPQYDAECHKQPHEQG